MKNKVAPLILLFISSLLLNCALIFPAYASWLIFIFLVPFFYIVLTRPGVVSFGYGFFWGVAFFIVHLSGFFLLFYTQANSKWSVLVPLFVSLYFALYSGILFMGVQYTLRFIRHTITSLFVVWAIWTYLYFAWIRYGSLWVLGKFIGYPFCYPLLPLARCKFVVCFLSFSSKGFVLMCVIIFSLCIALFFAFFKKRYLVYSALCLFPFLYSFYFLCDSVASNKSIEHIGYISPIEMQKYTYPLDVAQEVLDQMITLIDQNPDVNVVVMPESSCNFCLNEHQYVIDLWYKNILDNRVNLLIGAPYKDGAKIYNSLYWIKGGVIQKVYHKTNLMAFTEYVSPFWQRIPYMKNLFLDEESFFSHGKSCLITFNICKDITVKPLICSDFFIGKRSSGKSLKKQDFSAVLIVVNDQAFPVVYLRNLMFLSACLEAINRRKDILYVGYYFAAWVGKDGFVDRIDPIVN